MRARGSSWRPRVNGADRVDLGAGRDRRAEPVEDVDLGGEALHLHVSRVGEAAVRQIERLLAGSVGQDHEGAVRIVGHRDAIRFGRASDSEPNSTTAMSGPSPSSATDDPPRSATTYAPVTPIARMFSKPSGAPRTRVVSLLP